MADEYTGVVFENGVIEGIWVKDLRKYLDERGWLCELFRHDEIAADLRPSMAYASQTLPGIKRGPHAHRDQTDIFFFLGPGNFKLVLWDNRPDSATYRTRQTVYGGHDCPRLVVVPSGVVHGYKSLGPGPGLVFNAPNRLYGGEGRKDTVDEIRYEDDATSPFSF